MKNKNNNKKENNTMNTMIDKQENMNFGPTQADITHAIKQADLKYAELTKKLDTLPVKGKGTLQMVEERAEAAVDKHFLVRGYYPMTQTLKRGPIDRMYYKVKDGKPIFYNIDVKGINPNANYKPAFKPRVDKKFLVRDKAVNRIVAIEYNGTIKFIPGYLDNYKNLKDKYIDIID